VRKCKSLAPKAKATPVAAAVASSSKSSSKSSGSDVDENAESSEEEMEGGGDDSAPKASGVFKCRHCEVRQRRDTPLLFVALTVSVETPGVAMWHDLAAANTLARLHVCTTMSPPARLRLQPDRACGIVGGIGNDGNS
jgi:hypothetical protein